jgi:D-3-phosphoglycerate dehydrogenase
MVKEKHFRMMKPTAHLINTARGEIIDEKALLKALHRKWIAGAALDVIWDEAGDGSHLKGNPLMTYARTSQNLIIVPHIGGAAYEAMHVTEKFIANLVKKYCK